MKRPPEKPVAHEGKKDNGHESHAHESEGGVIRVGGIGNPALKPVIWLRSKPIVLLSNPDLMRNVHKRPEGGQYTQQCRYAHGDKYISAAGSRLLSQLETLKLMWHYIALV
jgi:hypothetical protein